MDKERVCIYISNKADDTLLRHKSIFKHLITCLLLSPYISQDLFAGIDIKGIEYVGNNIQEAMPYFDTMLFPCKASCSDAMYSSLVKNNKKIEFTQNDNFKLFTSLPNYSCPATVISVCGMYMNTQKFALTLDLYECLVSDGYKVTVIGSSPYSKYFGFYEFPLEIFVPSATETAPIRFLNVIKRIYEIEKPDILLMCIPGGVGNIPGNCIFNWSTVHKYVFNALPSDYIIYNMFNESYTPSAFNNIISSAENSFNKAIDLIGISRNAPDWLNKDPKKAYDYYVSLDPGVVEKRIERFRSSCSRPIYLVESHNPRFILNDLINKRGRKAKPYSVIT